MSNMIPILDGNEHITITTQAEFEAVFGSGDEVTISAYTSIFLAPIRDADAPIAYNGKKAYLLKNKVSLSSCTSIIGFNEADTLIMKDGTDVYFEILGTSDIDRITNIRLSGWTFDGQGNVNGLGGSLLFGTSAFQTAWARDCIISCRIVNHKTNANGGALRDLGTSDNMTIDRIYDCQANEGGGVYGCNDANIVVTNCVANSFGGGVAACNKSVINAYKCIAGEGGGVANCENNTVNVYDCNANKGGGARECNNSIIVARNCSATDDGGGAFHCDYITMTAIDCSSTDQGGGAYHCHRMVGVGSWSGNSAGGPGDNINADGTHEYLGLFAVDDTRVFKNDWVEVDI